jgi:hypothetical protein
VRATRYLASIGELAEVPGSSPKCMRRGSADAGGRVRSVDVLADRHVFGSYRRTLLYDWASQTSFVAPLV